MVMSRPEFVSVKERIDNLFTLSYMAEMSNFLISSAIT